MISRWNRHPAESKKLLAGSTPTAKCRPDQGSCVRPPLLIQSNASGSSSAFQSRDTSACCSGYRNTNGGLHSEICNNSSVAPDNGRRVTSISPCVVGISFRVEMMRFGRIREAPGSCGTG